jgi:hypothetical protein
MKEQDKMEDVKYIFVKKLHACDLSLGPQARVYHIIMGLEGVEHLRDKEGCFRMYWNIILN